MKRIIEFINVAYYLNLSIGSIVLVVYLQYIEYIPTFTSSMDLLVIFIAVLNFGIVFFLTTLISIFLGAFLAFPYIGLINSTIIEINNYKNNNKYKISIPYGDIFTFLIMGIPVIFIYFMYRYPSEYYIITGDYYPLSVINSLKEDDLLKVYSDFFGILATVFFVILYLGVDISQKYLIFLWKFKVINYSVNIGYVLIFIILLSLVTRGQFQSMVVFSIREGGMSKANVAIEIHGEDFKSISYISDINNINIDFCRKSEDRIHLFNVDVLWDGPGVYRYYKIKTNKEHILFESKKENTRIIQIKSAQKNC